MEENKARNQMQLLCCSNYFKELEDFYTNKSILDIVGVSRRETVHTNFLYWLLNDKESHKLGTVPLRSFIFACMGQKYRIIGNYELNNNVDYIFPNDWLNILLPSSRGYDIENYKIDTEYYIKDVGRIDLLLSFKLIANSEYKVKDKEQDMLFIIENKIDSAENNEQTQKYYDYFSKAEEFKNKKKVYIYLVPDMDLNKPCCNNFLPFQYQDAINMTISKCLEHPTSCEVKSILNSYLRSLTFSSNSDNSIVAITNKEINNVCMLWKEYTNELYEIAKQDTDLSKELYTMHKQVFDNIFYISSKYCSELQVDVLNAINNLLVLKSDKNTVSYEYNGELYRKYGGNHSLKMLALEIVKGYVAKEQDNIKDLDDLISKLSIYYSNKLPLIIKAEDSKKTEFVDSDTGKSLYFNEEENIIKLNNGERVVLYAYWANNEVQKLIEQTKNIVDVKVKQSL